MNYQQILTGLCFVLVVLLIFDIHLRMNEPSMVQYIYPTTQESLADENRSDHGNSQETSHLPPQGQFDYFSWFCKEKSYINAIFSFLPIISTLKVLQKLEVKSLSQEQIESANDKAKLSQEELDFVLKVRSKDLGLV